MKFIIGGAYQGKLNYVMEKYQKKIVANGEVCSLNDTFHCEILNNFEILIKRFFNTINDVIHYLDLLLKENPNIIIISTEIGYGIVPIEKSDRIYRELIGRVCCEVSKKAETVERVFCGLGVSIK